MYINVFIYLVLIFAIITLVVKYINQAAIIKRLQKNEGTPSDSIGILKMLDGPARANFDLQLLERIDNSNLILAGAKLSVLFQERFFSSKELIGVGDLGRYIMHLKLIEDTRKREILEEMLRDAAERSSDEILNYISFKSDIESVNIEESNLLIEDSAALWEAYSFVMNILQYRHNDEHASTK